MNPRWQCPKHFEAVLTDRTQRTFLFRRHVYRVRLGVGFALCDDAGALWRPLRLEYDSDGASIPHPIDWLVPPLDPLRYRLASMGIHDPACREGALLRWDGEDCRWMPCRVSRTRADELLRQGILASGGWRATAGTYWAGVRIGAAFDRMLAARNRRVRP